MRFVIWERSRKVVNLYINIKVTFTIGAIDCWNKTQNNRSNHSTQIKSKLFLLKDALTNTNNDA